MTVGLLFPESGVDFHLVGRLALNLEDYDWQRLNIRQAKADIKGTVSDGLGGYYP